MIFEQDEAKWGLFGPIMRADFCCFDEYVFNHADQPPFDFPIHCFWAAKDAKITKAMMEDWKRWTTADFTVDSVPEAGHLLALYDANQRKAYFTAVQHRIAKYL